MLLKVAANTAAQEPSGVPQSTLTGAGHRLNKQLLQACVASVGGQSDGRLACGQDGEEEGKCLSKDTARQARGRARDNLRPGLPSAEHTLPAAPPAHVPTRMIERPGVCTSIQQGLRRRAVPASPWHGHATQTGVSVPCRGFKRAMQRRGRNIPAWAAVPPLKP